MSRKKRVRYNPYEENHSYIKDNSSDPPPPDYDEYYLFTGLYLFFVPFAITMIAALLSNSDKGIDIFSCTPLFVAFAMFLYAYFSIGKFKFNKPDSLFRLYLPVIIYLSWQLFLTVMFNLFVHDGAFLYALLSLNSYGGMKIDRAWWLTTLLNWLYNLAIFGGFTAGERLAFHKTKVYRKPFRIETVRLVLICSAMMLLISESVWFYKRRDIIERDPKQNGHGFAYEDGYSSTNLEPYYVENEDNILAKSDTEATFIVSDPAKMPVLDGAEAAYPVYSAFANTCYENIGEIQQYAKENKRSDPDAIMPIKFNNSVVAFENLITGDADIFFGAKPSAEQWELATQAGKELVLTPIGKEAFVFFVNNDNPVDGLTSDQIRGIYSGKITNWKKVGGADGHILAFQRPSNSGSQTMMEYFMGDIQLKDPVQTEYVSSMGDLILDMADYQNSYSAIGYSFRYFASVMIKDMDYSDHIKYLSVDGIYPDEETIRSGEYPMTTELYAVTLADNPNENVELFLEWMTGPQGQQIVSDTGYVNIDD